MKKSTAKLGACFTLLCFIGGIAVGCVGLGTKDSETGDVTKKGEALVYFGFITSGLTLLTLCCINFIDSLYHPDCFKVDGSPIIKFTASDLQPNQPQLSALPWSGFRGRPGDSGSGYEHMV